MSGQVAYPAFGAPPEPYVTKRDLAHRMGVSISTVNRWMAEGMPHETWGQRCVRFLPSQAMAWARARREAA